jgi:formylglycine-generating enzyme required for sulfatase activity
MGTLFFCMEDPAGPDGHPDQGKYKGLFGQLVDMQGKALFGAKVTAINATGGLHKSDSLNAAGTDSVTTDSSGYYSFKSLTAGTYNLQGDYSNGALVILITDITYDSAGAVKEVKTDTLRAPGQIAGSVNTHTDDDGGVLCYIPGTSYLAMTDDSGGFVLSHIPQGNYRVTYRKDGLMTVGDTNIEVRSGEKTLLPEKDMEADPSYPPPAPSGLSVTYDTLHGCALLTWNPVIVSDLAGYVIYGNDPLVINPQQLNTLLCTDTFYIDTVFHDLMDTANLTFTYRVKAQDNDANLSTVYSKPVTITTPSPTKVRTSFSWEFLNTLADTASVNDTVSIIVTYRNETRKIAEISWYINSRDSLFSTVDDSSLTGSDTIRYAWPTASSPKIYVSMVDEAQTTWWDSTTIEIVQDVPTIAFLSADTVVDHNGIVQCSVYVAQRFGTMTIDVDTANTGDFIRLGNIGLSGGKSCSIPVGSACSWDSVKIRIVDDDSNNVLQAFNVAIRPQPLTITAIDSTDTTITVQYAKTQETDFAHYRIYRNTTNNVDTNSELWATISAGDTVSCTTPQPGYAWNPRFYRVYQKDTEGLWSAGSNVVYGCIINSPPATPIITYPANDGDTIWHGTALRWTMCADPNNNSVRYRVMADDNSMGYAQFKTGLVDTFVKLSGFCSLLKVKLVAYDTLGDSSWSDERIIEVKCPKGMRMINGGTFSMGQIGTAEPVHSVTLSPFFMDTTEVTQADYFTLMGVNPSCFTGDMQRPVEGVSWFDAVLYCNARSKRDGCDTVYSYTTVTGTPGNGCSYLGNLNIDMIKSGYRLPTEAQWEYACRAGTTTKYFWGDDSSDGDSYAWTFSNSGKITHAVAMLLPNAWGLYDMSGNVWEWVNDWFGGYPNNSQIDPTGPENGERRIRRGCSMYYYLSQLNWAIRSSGDPVFISNDEGFRCVL